jgi:hypothetical protein
MFSFITGCVLGLELLSAEDLDIEEGWAIVLDLFIIRIMFISEKAG